MFYTMHVPTVRVSWRFLKKGFHLQQQPGFSRIVHDLSEFSFNFSKKTANLTASKRIIKHLINPFLDIKTLLFCKFSKNTHCFKDAFEGWIWIYL